MSDIQSKIAARRALLAQQEDERQSQETAAEERLEAAAQLQTEAALNSLAAELSAGGTTVKSDGNSLSIENRALHPIDIAGLKKSQIDALLKKEIRQRWSSEENWVVIGLIVSGVILAFSSIYFSVLIVLGILMGNSFNNTHRPSVINDHPELFSKPDVNT